jgi:hypothetical protein
MQTARGDYAAIRNAYIATVQFYGMRTISEVLRLRHSDLVRASVPSVHHMHGISSKSSARTPPARLHIRWAVVLHPPVAFSSRDPQEASP